MKLKSLASLLLAVCGHVSAAGAYDGIYQFGSSAEWYSVHQSGNSLIVGNFISNTPFPIGWALGNGQNYVSEKNDYWNLLGGTITGAIAKVEGEVVAGACYVSATADFSVAGRVSLIVTAASATARGLTQNINCTALILPTGSKTLILTKIF